MNEPNIHPPLDGQEPEQVKQAQMAMLRMMTTAPETIVSMLDRLEIPWARTNVPGIEDGPCLLIKWKDLVEGEKRNQEQGPFAKRLVEEMKAQTEGLL